MKTKDPIQLSRAGFIACIVAIFLLGVIAGMDYQRSRDFRVLQGLQDYVEDVSTKAQAVSDDDWKQTVPDLCSSIEALDEETSRIVDNFPY